MGNKSSIKKRNRSSHNDDPIYKKENDKNINNINGPLNKNNIPIRQRNPAIDSSNQQNRKVSEFEMDITDLHIELLPQNKNENPYYRAEKRDWVQSEINDQEYKNQLVRFIDKRKAEAYGVCQYLLVGKYVDSGSRYDHYTYFIILRSGKEIKDQNNGEHFCEFTKLFPKIPKNHLLYIDIGSESHDNFASDEDSLEESSSNEENHSYNPSNKLNLKNQVRKLIEIVKFCDNPVEKKDLKNSRSRSAFPLNELPNSVWIVLFSQFKISELPQLMTVCKKWKSFFDNDLHWEMRTQKEFKWMENKLPEKPNTLTWNQFYLRLDWEITINEVDSNNKALRSHKVQVSPNASISQFMNLIQRTVVCFEGDVVYFHPSKFDFKFHRKSKFVKETGLKNGSSLNFRYEEPIDF